MKMFDPVLGGPMEQLPNASLKMWPPGDGRVNMSHFGPQNAAERSLGQLFRARVGFLVLCVIGLYYAIHMLVEFRSVLEPFLWSVIFITAVRPVVSWVEGQLVWFCVKICVCVFGVGGGDRKKDDEEDNSLDDHSFGTMSSELEMQGLIDDGQAGHDPATSGRADAPRRGEAFGSHRGFVFLRYVAKGAAIILVLGAILSFVMMFFFFVLQSARRMREHWTVYQQGAENIRKAVMDFLNSVVAHGKDGGKGTSKG